ncbi:MAG: hypothetical protein IJ148_01685 [Bacteroidaceae bacterium]|nr:hypothetical protein [Bacteroidaceae bacterium]
MKKTIYTLSLAALVLCVYSCRSNDDFTESIFDTEIPDFDKNSTTGPFDEWLYHNFVEPYNTEIQYKFNMPASKLEYLLSPAEYKKSQLLAHFIKYLFYDVYTKYAGDEFMKKYGPRIFHFIGSSAYSPTTGTEELGYASAGVKITLLKVNETKLWSPTDQYTPKDMDDLNEHQFHTMHHEFSHILHQTKSYPVSFGQVTPGDYDGRDWQKRDSVLSHTLGFVTQYGSSATYEDFVETLSCAITNTDCRWMYAIIDACANGGVKEGDKERVYELIDSLEIEGLDDSNKPWNNFTLKKEIAVDNETGEETTRFVPDFHELDSRTHAAEESTKTVTYTVEKKFTSFRDYLDNWVQIDTSSETGGMNALLKKFDIATEWYTSQWGLHLFELRREVKQRQRGVNEYVRDSVTIFELQ